MKQVIFAAALAVGMASTAPAFADRWVTPVNGTVSAITMPDGDVMMKIQIPAKESQVVDRDMRAHHDHCKIQEIYTDAPNTMIVVCGSGI